MKRTAEEWERIRIGMKEAAGVKAPEKQRLTMHLRWGDGPSGAECGECVHFRGRPDGHFGASRYKKCAQYGDTNGPGTDWRVHWPACGLFERTA